jgi:hypothetical protein
MGEWGDGGNECETYGTMALMHAGAKAEDEGLKSPRVDLEVDIACFLCGDDLNTAVPSDQVPPVHTFSCMSSELYMFAVRRAPYPILRLIARK